MEPLQLNQELMTLICVCASSEATPWFIKVRRLALVVTMLILLSFGWVSSIVFIILYFQTDLRSALYAIFQIAAEFSAWYTVIVTFTNPKLVQRVILKFRKVRSEGNVNFF